MTTKNEAYWGCNNCMIYYTGSINVDRERNKCPVCGNRWPIRYDPANCAIEYTLHIRIPTGLVK